jgi:hypothetical protein
MNRLLPEDVAHLNAGDFVEAEFQELTPLRFQTNWQRDRGGVELGQMERIGGGEPTGNTYTLNGELSHYESAIFPEDSTSLEMPNGMCVRQSSGEPGGWLVRIVNHMPAVEAKS